MNLISGCHRCKVKVFHYRREENKTILPFYRKHLYCGNKSGQAGNVETLEDQIQEQYWMVVYKTDKEIQKLAGKEKKHE